MIRTLIVHDVCLISDLLAKALNDQDDIVVAGRVASPEAALEFLKENEVDVVLVNILLPEQGALGLTKTIAKKFDYVKVVVTGLLESRTAILQCLEIGAAGYVQQDDSVDDLIIKVRHVARGEALVSPQVAGALIARLAELKRLATELNGYQEISLQDQCTELTAREREILDLIGKGYTNQRIADELIIGVGTVKNHVHNILEKLDVHTRKQAAMIARQLAMGEAMANGGTEYTWPSAYGVNITSRREAASML
ncbi:MAG TPA: response regulator transcription factor [Caldilineaceae bacterium]|nr:response regulator transcription factor [Caldilineaceae bacterium]